MTEFTKLPDGWKEVKYDVGESLSGEDHTEEIDAIWASEDDRIVVMASNSIDEDGTVTFPVVVEQTIDPDDAPVTTVQSHAIVEDNRKMAERMSVEFMHEVNDGLHRLRTMGVEETEKFYEYYCISDSELPGSMTGDQLIESVDGGSYEDEIEDLPEDFDPGTDTPTIQIDVFPRRKDEVGGNR